MGKRVTIAIPTYNREEYLRISLSSALVQTYPDLEIIVSNNACTDKTSDFLKGIDDPRVRILEHEHTVSMMQNWNSCLNAATGKYFLLLSDDDVLDPSAIEELVAAYTDGEKNGADLGFVYCRGRMIDAHGRVLAEGHRSPESEGARDLVFAFFNSKRSLWPCAILFRKEEMSPGYSLEYTLGADAVQWMRAVSRHGTARFVDKSLAQYRVHQNATLNAEIEVWRKENNSMAEFAIVELGKHQLLRDGDVRRLRRGVQRFNVQTTSSLINQSLKNHKVQALVAYLKDYRVFLSPYGVFRFMRGLLALALKPAK
jgi:glycosyltransferase involved in cell wall biosynthesis